MVDRASSATRGRQLRVALIALIGAVALPPAANAADYSTVQLFGYYAARITPAGGDHLAEVADRSNLNWVQISDVDRYRPEVLDGCKPRGCVISTGHEFFTGCDDVGSASCALYPDYRERWHRLADAVSSRIDRVGAFYLLDEPQWHGASPADIATAAETINQTYPSLPVMMVEAGPQVTDALDVPAQVDWVGFDWYCQPFSEIERTLATLEQRTAPHQGLFLLPEAAPLAECDGAPGHATDAEIAALQWDYFHLAEAHPRVIGLLAFGFWTSGYDSADLPLTVAAHREIAARVIRPADQAVTVGVTGKRLSLDRKRVVRVTLTCPAAEVSGPCEGRLRLRTRRRLALGGSTRRRRVVLAGGPFLIDAGRAGQVRLKLTRRKARLVRRRKAARKVWMIARVGDQAGNSAQVQVKARVAPRRRAKQ